MKSEGHQNGRIFRKLPDIGKAAARHLEDLLSLFEEICARSEVPAELLKKFQANYLGSTREERIWFFHALLHRFEIRKEHIKNELRLLQEADEHDVIHWSGLLTDFRRKMESPRMRAFRKTLNISGGLKFLLDLRADILSLQRQITVNLEPLDEEIAHLFTSWFQQGFLFLQEITQDSSYRQIRFLKEHDLVHPMTSIEEMSHRLGEDRRCFALYHVSMPDEPVVFIEVALSRGIVGSIHEIIGSEEPPQDRKGKADTALFYSINNTQNGLAGLGLGKTLIFQVVAALSRDHPGIRTFATLSPIPGLWDRYLKCILRGEDEPFSLKKARLGEFFPDRSQEDLLHRLEEQTARETSFPEGLLQILSDPRWIDDPEYCRLLRKPMTDLTHHYISNEKNKRGRPLNPVANFHMGNGATVALRNVHFGANRSRKGIEESCSMMVNYIYSSSWLQQIGRTMQSWLPWKT